MEKKNESLYNLSIIIIKVSDKSMIASSKQKLKNKYFKFIPLYFMMLPGLLYIIINNYLPMFGVIIAFKNINYSKGILGSDWTGFSNFEYLFKTKDAFEITRNTVLYNSSFILINLIVAIAIAIALSEIVKQKLARLYQNILLLPYLISMVIVGYLVYSLLSMENGFMNNSVLPLLGLEEIMWYGKASVWPIILTIVNAWKNVGYLSVIYYASILGIDKGLYEAAEIDGANKLQQIRRITLPLMTPVITVMTLLQIGRIFYSDFGLFYQVPMNTGAILSTTNVIDTYVYRALMVLGDIWDVISGRLISGCCRVYSNSSGQSSCKKSG